jgi:hypothetical protein
MSRKDYELIAAAIRDVRASHPAYVEGADAVAAKLAHALQCREPRFDRSRFIAACRNPAT